uniref:peroxiredoxin-2-like n=1 Tax=Callithrix jacchus TaxID=9483 RepID=UPI0023DD573F|nr:peroxiredoxin-2-like [Callithrix jacchus]
MGREQDVYLFPEFRQSTWRMMWLFQCVTWLLAKEPSEHQPLTSPTNACCPGWSPTYRLKPSSRKEGGLGPLNIPLLADVTRCLSEDYGVLKTDEDIAYRGLFVIDCKGVLRQITVNDLPVGRSVDEALRLVQAFQYTDKHGEVCPAGWKPGSDTIKPNMDDSKEYFSKHN